MKYKAIIFDMDGVVVDSESVWTKADRKFLSNHGINVGLQAYESKIKHLIMGSALPEGVKLMQLHFKLKGDVNRLAEERRAIVKNLLANEAVFMPGFLGFFKELPNSIKKALATSAERVLINSIDQKLKLSKFFGKNIFSIEDIGFISKPNPAIFLHTAKNLGINPKFCIVIEDSLKGVMSAEKAGMYCIAITTTSKKTDLLKAGADLVVSSFGKIRIAKIL